jgi:hypothetical protein
MSLFVYGLVKTAVFLLSQSANHIAILPSAKVVDSEIIWLIFIALDVQAI